MTSSLRIGHGFDVHAFADHRKLILGTITIPHSKGLVGHSDADVLLHCLTDAVLGALALGDIGQWFPDSDERYRDADSAKLFGEVWTKVSGDGWSLVNADAVIMAQEPKLAQHLPGMQLAIAKLFGAEVSQIGLKATTTEQLGFVGRREGIAASAVVLLQRNAR